MLPRAAFVRVRFSISLVGKTSQHYSSLCLASVVLIFPPLAGLTGVQCDFYLYE